MTSLLHFLPRVRTLESTQEVQDLVADLLGQLLLVEGPPVEPIPGVSEDIREGIIRSPKGRAMCFARTWTTGPWRCLLMEIPSVPMGRPIFLNTKDPDSRGPARAITDSRSQGFQRRIVAACHDLGVSAPLGEGAVHAVLGSTRTFLAWRDREIDEPMARELRGDADNFAKNLLDGLQQAGVLPNDRGVFRLTAAKEAPASWAEAPPPLEETIRREAMDRHAQGKPLETIRVELRLSKAHMGRIFSDYKPGKALKPLSPGADLAAGRQAADLILTDGLPYHEARVRSGASGTSIRKALAASLRPRVLEGKTTLQDLASELQLTLRAAATVFQGDKKAQAALQKAGKAAQKVSRASQPTRTKAEASQALQKALDAHLKDGISVVKAADDHQVSLASLTSKLHRLRKGEKKVSRKPRK